MKISNISTYNFKEFYERNKSTINNTAVTAAAWAISSYAGYQSPIASTVGFVAGIGTQLYFEGEENLDPFQAILIERTDNTNTEIEDIARPIIALVASFFIPSTIANGFIGFCSGGLSVRKMAPFIIHRVEE